MSEWFYIRMAYGLTWAVIAGYSVLLVRRQAAAEQALRDMDGGVS